MKYIFLFICFCASLSVYSQHVFIDSIDKKVFPTYNFEEDLMDSIMSSIVSHNADIETTVHLYFTIDTLGQICNINILKGLSESFNNEIIEKNLYKMPKWIPAEYKGKKVESIVYLTIRIYIEH